MAGLGAQADALREWVHSEALEGEAGRGCRKGQVGAAGSWGPPCLPESRRLRRGPRLLWIPNAMHLMGS